MWCGLRHAYCDNGDGLKAMKCFRGRRAEGIPRLGEGTDN